MPSLKQLRKHPKVEIIDDERAIGNGLIVTLKKGYSFCEATDNRVLGEDTIKELHEQITLFAKPYAGPYDA